MTTRQVTFYVDGEGPTPALATDRLAEWRERTHGEARSAMTYRVLLPDGTPYLSKRSRPGASGFTRYHSPTAAIRAMRELWAKGLGGCVMDLA